VAAPGTVDVAVVVEANAAEVTAVAAVVSPDTVVVVPVTVAEFKVELEVWTLVVTSVVLADWPAVVVTADDRDVTL